MRKMIALILAVTLVFAASSSALAFSWASSLTDIYDVGGQDVVIPGPDFTIHNSLNNPFGGSINFDIPMEVRTANLTWGGWNNGFNGNVLWTLEQNNLRISFDNAISAWGMHYQPNRYATFDFTFGLSDGNTINTTVNGEADQDAAFFGFTDAAVDYIDIEVFPEPGDDPLGFAIGQMAVGPDPVPEPATLLLFGIGMAGAGMYRRMKK